MLDGHDVVFEAFEGKGNDHSGRDGVEAKLVATLVELDDRFGIVDAEQALYQALADYASSRYTYVLDLLNLRQAAGIIDVNTVRDLNESLKRDRQVSLVLQDADDTELDGPAQ